MFISFGPHSLTVFTLTHTDYNQSSSFPPLAASLRPPPRAPPPPLARPHRHQPLRYTLQGRFSIINRKEFLIDAGVLKTAPFFSSLFLSLFCYSSRARGATRCHPSPSAPRSFRRWMCRGAWGFNYSSTARGAFVCQSKYLSNFATGKTAVRTRHVTAGDLKLQFSSSSSSASTKHLQNKT